MASSRESVDVSSEELERLQAAMQSQNFRDLLLDYVREVNDPTNRAVYEEHVKNVERERGYEVTFVHPDPDPDHGYVLKTTSIQGDSIVLKPNAGHVTVPTFINLAASVCVDKPSCKRISDEDGGQVFWTVPHTFSPPRNIQDNGVVYDCVFHPDTLKLAASNGCFKEMIEEMAMNGIEFNFKVKLNSSSVECDQTCRYKGPSIATIIRRPLSSDSNPSDVADADPHSSPVILDEVQIPENSIKFRQYMDMQDFAIGVKDPSSGLLDVADEIVVEIHLPLVQSSNEVHLDVQTNELFLKSLEGSVAGHRYALGLKLPCAVREDDGRAQFDSERKVLTVVLPTYACEVRRKSSTDKSPLQIMSSSNDVDGTVVEQLEAMTVKDDVKPAAAEVMQSASKHLLLPDFTCHQDDQEIVFVLKTENVRRDSVRMDHLHDGMACRINYSNVGAGCVAFDYGLFLRFPCPCRVEPAGTTTTVNEDSVVVIFKKSVTSRTNWKGYFYDTDGTHELKEANIEVSSLQESLNALWNDSKKVADIATKPLPVSITEVNKERIVIEFPGNKESMTTTEKSKDETAITEQHLLDKLKEPKSQSSDLPNCVMRPRKFRSVSESSVDTMGASARRMLRGILKYPRRVRALSESSDDYSWSSADYTTMDSDIPEEEGSESAGNREGGDGTGRKKSVHFNSNITKTLFRSNSSILGQRKKKQRRRQRKHDVEQQRRTSESECSEGESSASSMAQAPIVNSKSNGCIVGNRNRTGYRNMPNANGTNTGNDASTDKSPNDNETERKFGRLSINNNNNNNNNHHNNNQSRTSNGGIGGRQQVDKNGNGIRQNGRKQTTRRDNNKGQVNNGKGNRKSKFQSSA